MLKLNVMYMLSVISASVLISGCTAADKNTAPHDESGKSAYSQSNQSTQSDQSVSEGSPGLPESKSETGAYNKDKGTLKSLNYSNLLDTESQEEVKAALVDSGIDENAIKKFFDSVNYFNSNVDTESLVQKGFISSEKLSPEYDQISIQQKWAEKNPDFIGCNCRITTFTLLKDLMKIKNSLSDGNSDSESDFLTFDISAVKNAPESLFDDEQMKFFKSVFDEMPTTKSMDTDVHVEAFKKEWQKRGVSFDENSKARMISVVFNSDLDDKQTLFIGHVGVLVPGKDNKLLFIEKLAFQEPYQVLKFDDKSQVAEYLMYKYDVEWDQKTAHPFIMDNDSLIEGYGIYNLNKH